VAAVDAKPLLRKAFSFVQRPASIDWTTAFCGFAADGRGIGKFVAITAAVERTNSMGGVEIRLVALSGILATGIGEEF
jgi:hypothetical protein